MSSETIRHGSCLCKAVKYELKGDPFVFYVCHCINCRKVSGSAFMSNCFFKPERVTITHGNDTIKTFDDFETERGKPFTRWFCPQCGSSLFMNTVEKTFRIVAAGTIDDEFPWMPQKSMFPTCQRPWVEKLKFVEKPRKAKL